MPFVPFFLLSIIILIVVILVVVFFLYVVNRCYSVLLLLLLLLGLSCHLSLQSFPCIFVVIINGIQAASDLFGAWQWCQLLRGREKLGGSPELDGQKD